MTQILRGRRTADVGQRQKVVVFLVGMRINRLWQFWRWLPVIIAMVRMVIELLQDPTSGLLARPRTYLSGRTVLLVQYWNSFDDLERYARDSNAEHLPAWRWFNQRIRDNGSVGIFHETYHVDTDQLEAGYSNMPRFGLGATRRSAPVPITSQQQTAAVRIGARRTDKAPVDPY